MLRAVTFVNNNAMNKPFYLFSFYSTEYNHLVCGSM